MLHAKGQVVSSFSFPNCPQLPIPNRSLPPPQSFMGTAVGMRGKPNRGITSINNRRGHPFSITWSVGKGIAQGTFGLTGTYEIPWLTFAQFQLIVNSSNPLRTYALFYSQWYKG
jgi:hypothetical protein